MDNENIKEILNDIDNKECYYVGTNGCLYQDLSKEELLCIKDYITNLQKEINKLTAESTEWESKYYDLQEKLKEYKMLFDAFSERPYAHRYLEEKKKELGNSKIIGLDSEMIYKDYYDLKEENEKVYKDFNELSERYFFTKSRNEKAIEYIKNKWKKEKYYQDIENCMTFCDFDKNDLLNILNGDDK